MLIAALFALVAAGRWTARCRTIAPRMLALWLGAGCLVAGSAPVGAQESADPPATPKPPRLNYAHIEIKGNLAEGVSPPGLFGELTENLDSVLGRLKKAGDDEKLTGVVLHVGDLAIGWAKIHELRSAIAKVRAKGKTVLAWMESGTTKEYLIVSAADKVVLPESGILMMPGLRAEVMFYKNLFDWLQIEPQMLRVGEYKSAAEPYSRSEMSPQFREELGTVLDGFYSYIVDAIAASRKLSADQVTAALDVGLLTAADAKTHGLIDQIGYEDALAELAKGGKPGDYRVFKGYGKKKLDTDFSGMTGMIKMMNLLMGVEPQQRQSSADKIAVISAVGPIMSGPSQADLFGESTMGSATMIKAIRQARDDATVKAIVLRIDSPGGSALASDLMWHELETVKKPFIVSMGDVAASGGYYIAMGADRIFAEPGTITGSIGVVGGKLAVEKFLAKFGVTVSVVQRGKNSGVLSAVAPFSDTERATMQKMLDDIYRQFTTKAASGRKMEVEKLEKLARGRIYTGQQALAIGLVDEVGTLDDAIAYAKKAAGLDPEQKLERLSLPKAANPFEQLLGPIDSETGLRGRSAGIGPTSEAATWRGLMGALPGPLREAVRDLQAFEGLAKEPALLVVPFRLTIR